MLYGSIRSTPRARNQSQARVTSRSGADAPEVMPTVRTPSSQRLVDLGLVVDQVRRDVAARATSTSRFEFDELREPITSRRSISASMSLTAHCRLEVA